MGKVNFKLVRDFLAKLKRIVELKIIESKVEELTNKGVCTEIQESSKSQYVRIKNSRLCFYFILIFILSSIYFLIGNLRLKFSVMPQLITGWSYMSLLYVTKKIIEDFEINNIIQYNNSILALQKAYGLQSRLVVMCTQTM